MKTKKQIVARIVELSKMLADATSYTDWRTTSPEKVYRIQGCIGALEWALRGREEETHP